MTTTTSREGLSREEALERGHRWFQEESARIEDRGQNPTWHHKEAPCQVRSARLREVDAAMLAALAQTTELESYPFLGQDGYIIREWSHILSGYPKGGKTELLFSCVGEWLKVKSIAVLWFSEESEAVWRYRLAGHPDFPQGLRLVFAMGANPEDLLERAKSGAEQVIIVDTIRNLLQISDESDNALIARTLGAWEAALQGRTRIYAHHERKGGGEHGQAIAGGAGFLGVVDRAIELRFDPRNRKRRQLTVHSRIQEAPDLMYEMEDGGTLRALGEPDEVGLAEVEERVVEVLNGEWRKTQEVLDVLGEPKPSLRQLRQALNNLHKAGKAQRNPLEDKPGAVYRWRLA